MALDTRKKAIYYLIFFLFLTVTISNALAQPPSAGSILSQERQQMTGRAIQKMRTSPPEEEAEKATATPAASETKVLVKNIEFTGHEPLISLKELKKLAAPYTGKESSLADLQRLTQEITRVLKEDKGFVLARAYLPEQDVTEGIVKIEIVAGRLDGKVEISIQKPYRINKRLLEKIAGNAMPDESAIRLKRLERATLLINNLPGMSSRAYLDKGKEPGTTRVTIDCAEGKLLSGMIYGDNFGNVSTGAFRRIGQLSVNDGFRSGDLLQLTYINSDYLNQGVGLFSFPLGAYGAFVDLSCNMLQYELSGQLNPLDANGHAITSNASIRYPLILTRTGSLWLGGGFDYLFLDDRIGSVVYDGRNIYAGSAVLTGSLYDGILGGGLSFFSVSLNDGSVDFTKGKLFDSAGPKTAGGYFRATYLAARLQRVTQDVSLLFSMRGQVSSKNLDSSQKFILGGPSGVRAYPVGEAPGDQGDVLTLEARYDVPFMPDWMKTQIIGFFDAGYVNLHRFNWSNAVTTVSGRNDYWISGAGPGINIEKKGLYRAQFSYGFQIGKNPGASTSGSNSDNLYNNGQFWWQGTIWF
jgi:hemolysin activation/secretion protein